MKIVFVLIAFFIAQGNLLANSDLYTRASNFDGLPLRLSDGREFTIGDEQINEYGSIDMAAYFIEMGVDVPKGGIIIYNVGSGSLIARLTKEGHELLDTALAFLYRHENHVAITRAYLALLGPLSGEERVSKVLNTGFIPDPLISSYISRIREIEKPIVEADVAKELFPDEKLFPKSKNSLSEAKRGEILKRVSQMKKKLEELLHISIERLNKEIDVIDTHPAEQQGGGSRDNQ